MELVPHIGLLRYGDVRCHEVGIVGDAVHIDRHRSFDITTDSQGYPSFPVEEEKAGRTWVLEMKPVCFVDGLDGLVVTRIRLVRNDD